MVFSKLMLSSLVGSNTRGSNCWGSKKNQHCWFPSCHHRERCLSPSRGTDINVVMEESIDFTVSLIFKIIVIMFMFQFTAYLEYVKTLQVLFHFLMCTVCVICYTWESITIVKLISDSTMKLASCLSSSVYSCKLPSHVVVILCSLFIQFVNITSAQYLENYTHRNTKVLLFTLLGIIYFSYPFLGYLADVKFTRYRILIFSFCLLLIGEATGYWHQLT